jgi:hypothetical protein
MCVASLLKAQDRGFIYPFFSLFLLERKKEFLVVIFTSSFLHELRVLDPFGCISLSSAQLSSASVLHSFPNSTCCLFTSGLEKEKEEGLFFSWPPSSYSFLFLSILFGFVFTCWSSFSFWRKNGAARVRKKKKKKKRKRQEEGSEGQADITLEDLSYIAQHRYFL